MPEDNETSTWITDIRTPEATEYCVQALRTYIMREMLWTIVKCFTDNDNTKYSKECACRLLQQGYTLMDDRLDKDTDRQVTET